MITPPKLSLFFHFLEGTSLKVQLNSFLSIDRIPLTMLHTVHTLQRVVVYPTLYFLLRDTRADDLSGMSSARLLQIRHIMMTHQLLSARVLTGGTCQTLTCCWPCSSPSARSGVHASPPAPSWPSLSTLPLPPWMPSLFFGGHSNKEEQRQGDIK